MVPVLGRGPASLPFRAASEPSARRRRPLASERRWTWMNREIVVEALRAGRLLLWNPYEGTGLPLLAQAQHAVLHPVTLLTALGPTIRPRSRGGSGRARPESCSSRRASRSFARTSPVLPPVRHEDVDLARLAPEPVRREDELLPVRREHREAVEPLVRRHLLERSEEHTSELQSQFHLVCRL